MIREKPRGGGAPSWLTGMSLDFRLGLRMLARHPGLTLVGVVGMAVAVAIGAVAFGIIYTLIDPGVPLDEGDRIVAIESFDPVRGNTEGRRTHLHDIITWRAELSAISELGAYRIVARNLIIGGEPPEGVRIAEMTASGFRIARVPPVLGRHLLESDEVRGAPPVAVIGHSAWQRRFAGDSAIIGRTIQLGATRHVVVGVMPDGFAFPVNHQIWTPLQLDPLRFERGQAPAVEVFGRLAPAATLEDAATQLTTIARRLGSEYPDTHATIQTRVLPYALSFTAPDSRGFHLGQVLISMLLVLVGTNVAILVYARTAGRAGEIAVRSALGASRGRIVAQLFAEALVLSAAAAVVGLMFARAALAQLDAIIARSERDLLPYWMTFDLSPGVVLYVAGLTMVGAVIVGVLPGLKATRHRVHAGLQQLGMGGSGMRLGRTWTVLIVAQIATAVAILPVAFHNIDLVVRGAAIEPAFTNRKLLIASLRLDRTEVGSDEVDAHDDDAFRMRFAQREAELVRRLEAEPGVANVVRDDGWPGRGGDWTRVEIAGSSASTSTGGESAVRPGGRQAGINFVDPDYFETFEIPLLAGRRFEPGDVSTSANVAIVEQAFVREVLGGSAPLGLQVRRVPRSSAASAELARSEPWYEIVGVVADFPTRPDPSGERRPRMYLPLSPGDAHPSTLIVQVMSEDAARFAGRLREIAATLDPMLRLEDVATVEARMNEERELVRLVFLTLVGVTASILLLSAAGIYALMSFTVTRRRREIGIRSALGAGPGRVAATVLSRAAGQIALGIVIGTGLAAAVARVIGSMSSMMRDLTWVTIVGLLLTVAAFMAAIGLAAALGPARRALRIQPTEALRAD